MGTNRVAESWAAYVQISLELHWHRCHQRIVADIDQLLLDARAHQRQLGSHLVQLGRRRWMRMIFLRGVRDKSWEACR